MLIVPHEHIKVIFCPKRPSSSEQPICQPAGMPFPCPDNFRHRNRSDFKQNVNMIWHHHPRLQFVALGVIVRTNFSKGMLHEIIFNQFGDFRATQMAFTPAFVQIGF